MWFSALREGLPIWHFHPDEALLSQILPGPGPVARCEAIETREEGLYWCASRNPAGPSVSRPFSLCSGSKEMKRPQQTFVVEKKTKRRQPNAQTKSIWGDTDLKALAREVEDLASHPFNSNEGRGTFGSRETRLVDPINAEPLNGRVEVALPEIQRANGTKVEISQHRVADTPTEAVAQTKERHTPSQRLSTSTGTARNRTKRLHDLKVGHEGRKAQTRTVDDPISLDELAALGADNKLLKRLLAELLLAQNLWLKKMLERFDAERDVAPLASGRKAREPEFRG